jgi:hypothetical protein
MSSNDAIAACDRLALIFGRAGALERGGRLATDDTVRAPVVPFVIAQLRMRVRPALTPPWASDPVHVVLFGGTNSGKSTVLNVLLGREAAGMGVRARFSQHPEAYRSAEVGDRWLDDFPSRFVGYERYHGEHPPRQSDAELRTTGYAPKLAVFDLESNLGDGAKPGAPGVVLWDAPDFSTEEARAYMGTVLDLAALADLVVVTVTDESYADDRAHALLRVLGDSGVAILVAANKVSDSPALLDDIATTLASSGQVRAPVYRLPMVAGASPAERLRRLVATREASALRQAVTNETRRGRALKAQGLRGAVALVEKRWREVLRPLEEEVGLAERWAKVVERTTRDRVLEPYRLDYLDGALFGEFNRTLVTVMRLLQVPWVGPFLEVTGRVVRAPFRLATAAVRRLAGWGDRAASAPPEQTVLAEAVANWLAALKAEAQALADADGHAAWVEVVRRLDGDEFRGPLLARFEEAFRGYRQEVDGLVRRRAEAIYGKLREDPRRLNVLRGANLLGNALTVAVVIKSVGFNWSDAVAGPVVAGLWQNLLEWGLGRYLEGQRAALKQEQFGALERLARSHLEGPARDLFRGAVTADELSAAVRDFALVKEGAEKVWRGV